MEKFLNPETLILASAISIIMVIFMMAILPVLVLMLPTNFFVRELGAHPYLRRLPPYLRFIVLFLKNSLGVVLLLAGVAMLVLPGQGLLTILMGLTLIDGPGKDKAIRYIVSRKFIRNALNRIRRWGGKEPFDLNLS